MIIITLIFLLFGIDIHAVNGEDEETDHDHTVLKLHEAGGEDVELN